MKPVRRGSVTARLAWLFAAIVMLTFLVVGSYLYRSLELQLEHRDDGELIGKITQTRHLLADAVSLRDVERAPDTLLNAMFGHEGLLFVILAADGRVLVRNAAFSGSLPAVAVVPADKAPQFTHIRDWNSDDGVRRVLAARGFVGSGAEQVVIVVARDGSEREALLRTYRGDLFLAAIIGALIASLLGYLLVRKGLRPISEVAHKANEITSRKLDARLRIEDAPAELHELTAAFNAMLDRLEDGMQRLAGFAADLAHDLRTPVNALMVKTQVALSRRRTTDEYHALLESNLEDYERLARLIESTLFLARADNQQLALSSQSIDLRAATDKVVDYFSGIADEAGVTMTVDGKASLVADPILYQRALGNLVSNAIRHTPPTGIVRLCVEERRDTVVVTVENPGTTIPADHLDRVFDRYFRGDAARTAASGSAGLGLAIVRAIMSLHGGTVHAESDDGVTRFALSFPNQRR